MIYIVFTICTLHVDHTDTSETVITNPHSVGGVRICKIYIGKLIAIEDYRCFKGEHFGQWKIIFF